MSNSNDTKKYASLSNLQTFKNNLDNIYATKTDVDSKLDSTDAITDDEIDEICTVTMTSYLNSISAEEASF